MTEKKSIATGLVLEGEEALERVSGPSGPVPCFVRHEDAGGKCLRPAVMEVYGLPFCEIHGAEVKFRALEELYYDAANFLARLDNSSVPETPRPCGRCARPSRGSGRKRVALQTTRRMWP